MNPANNTVSADAEACVRAVWTDVLGCPPPEGDQDFFEDLGGNSLLAFQATVRLREALGRHVPLKLLFTARTFNDYTARLQGECSS
ncbi:hypothetical protein AQI95_20770 [Streptomyces yokosukanensis]|uniref:Carrier domain-containing protein n=1 Tax=Streptomyces yokosukanensis TaxID=67386 RepID=A0A117Q1J3_9ACTN|nr:phosphopantetheine-binding protein [Streptomyces yokosukanensis]KUN03881.1 hypothetical protein AQI95_20770 [Streptomyces yokosukanensis]